MADVTKIYLGLRVGPPTEHIIGLVPSVTHSGSVVGFVNQRRGGT